MASQCKERREGLPERAIESLGVMGMGAGGGGKFFRRRRHRRRRRPPRGVFFGGKTPREGDYSWST